MNTLAISSPLSVLIVGGIEHEANETDQRRRDDQQLEITDRTLGSSRDSSHKLAIDVCAIQFLGNACQDVLKTVIVDMLPRNCLLASSTCVNRSCNIFFHVLGHRS